MGNLIIFVHCNLLLTWPLQNMTLFEIIERWKNDTNVFVFLFVSCSDEDKCSTSMHHKLSNQVNPNQSKPIECNAMRCDATTDMNLNLSNLVIFLFIRVKTDSFQEEFARKKKQRPISHQNPKWIYLARWRETQHQPSWHMPCGQPYFFSEVSLIIQMEI